MALAGATHLSQSLTIGPLPAPANGFDITEFLLAPSSCYALSRSRIHADGAGRHDPRTDFRLSRHSSVRAGELAVAKNGRPPLVLSGIELGRALYFLIRLAGRIVF